MMRRIINYFFLEVWRNLKIREKNKRIWRYC